MSRMIDDEETSKDYGLIEKCSNLVTDENKCLDTWDDENADYKECKRINCYKKQLQRAKAENEKLKEEVKEIRTWEELKLSKYRKALEDVKNLLYTAENTTNGDLYFELVSKAYMKCNEVLNET